MDKCPECRSEYGHTGNCSRMESNMLGKIMVLKRQLAAANKRAGRMEKVLEWYADEMNYSVYAPPEGPAYPSAVMKDDGSIAREALGVRDDDD